MHMRSLITRSQASEQRCPVRRAELRLSFTQGVVVAFSSVTISGDGGAVPASKPVNDPSNQQIIHVRLGHALKPGTYTVSWHVLSVDTHLGPRGATALRSAKIEPGSIEPGSSSRMRY